MGYTKKGVEDEYEPYDCLHPNFFQMLLFQPQVAIVRLCFGFLVGSNICNKHASDLHRYASDCKGVIE